MLGAWGENMERPDISVLIVTRNQADHLTVCLAHLERQSVPAARYEIIVVDEASTDGTCSMLDRYVPGAPVRTRYLRQARPGAAQARNLALAESQGRYVLFLDEDLLAGPHLLERHLQAHQQHESKAAILGHVALHPQIPEGSFTRWFMPEEAPEFRDEAEVPFADWRAYNFSVPRRLLQEAGGFDADFVFTLFADVDLAYRLTQQGVKGYFRRDACAYVWRQSNFNHERLRQYAKGYSLHTLAQKTHAPSVYSRYAVRRNLLLRGFDGLVMPLYTRLAQRLNVDTRLFGYFYRRILRYETFLGYSDARNGKQPRFHFSSQ
jgi:glycosyltransferase involved in cell wall biosynthesis